MKSIRCLQRYPSPPPRSRETRGCLPSAETHVRYIYQWFSPSNTNLNSYISCKIHRHAITTIPTPLSPTRFSYCRYPHFVLDKALIPLRRLPSLDETSLPEPCNRHYVCCTILSAIFTCIFNKPFYHRFNYI